MSAEAGFRRRRRPFQRPTARARVGRARRSSRLVQTTGTTIEADRRPWRVPGAFERCSTSPARRRAQTRRTEVPGVPGGRACARAVAAERTSAATVRRGDGATPRRFRRRGRRGAPRGARDVVIYEKQKTKTRNQKSIGNARPTTAPPSYDIRRRISRARRSRSPLASRRSRAAAGGRSRVLRRRRSARRERARYDAPRLEPASRVRRQRATATLKRPLSLRERAAKEPTRAQGGARLGARRG